MNNEMNYRVISRLRHVRFNSGVVPARSPVCGARPFRFDPDLDALICPRCSKEMRIVALIDQQAVIERILRHLGLWEQGVRVTPSTGPPAGPLPLVGRAGRPPTPVSRERIVEPWLDDPFPDYDTEPVMKYANE